MKTRAIKLINISLVICFTFLVVTSCKKSHEKYSLKEDGGVELSNILMHKNNKLSDSILKSIKVFYKDSLTNKNAIQYRELEYIGDNSYFSKPTIIDIEVVITENHFIGVLNISIEELFVPNLSFKSNIYGNMKIKDTTWCLHETLYGVNFIGNMSKKLKMNTIKLKDIDYKTAYYLDSALYNKIGFRVIAFYIPSVGEKIEVIKKEYFYND